MTEFELEQRLRGFYRDEIGFTEVASTALREGLADIARPTGRFGPWFGEDRRLLAFAVVALLTVAAVGAALLLSQPKPEPEPQPLPPASITLWMTLQNERSVPVEYSLTGADAAGGGIAACQSGVSSYEMRTPWSLWIDNQEVLTSEDGAVAYTGLAEGGNVVLRVVASTDGGLDVAPLSRGDGQGAGWARPAACRWYTEPAPGLAIPPEFLGNWRTHLPASALIGPATYRVWLPQGLVQRQSDPGDSYGSYVQGPMIALTDTQVTFGPSPVCPDPGIYRWEMTEFQSQLHLAPIDDACQERRELFASPLERQLDLPMLPGVRYVSREFGVPMTFEGLDEFAAIGTDEAIEGAYGATGGEEFYVRIPELGLQLTRYSNVAPATCTTPSDWLTGGPADGAEGYVEPRPITSANDFRAALEAWALRHPDVSVDPEREIWAIGDFAFSVDIRALETCGDVQPGLEMGDILERDYVIDLGGRLLIIAAGPGVYGLGESPDVRQAQVGQQALLDSIADEFVTSIQFR